MDDVFGRHRYVHPRTSSRTRGTLLEKSTFNGLGHRIRSHSDQDFDHDTDSNDPWVDMVYDDSWQTVATFRSGDAADRPR
jgi:hypothetical protein